MDYNKHLFDLKQKQKDAKKKQHQVQVKEIKLRPATDVGDYQVKLRAILKFLEEGNKVKITLRFRGREMAHQQLGLAQLQKIEADVAEFGVGTSTKNGRPSNGYVTWTEKEKVIPKKSTAKAVLFFTLISIKERSLNFFCSVLFKTIAIFFKKFTSRILCIF